MKLRIYNITHKPLKLVVNSIYQPLMVGDKVNKEIPVSFLRDDIVDNIADKNPNFCELTALYWLWKNVHDIDYIGICHYRRYFNFVNRFTFKASKEINLNNTNYNLDLVCDENYYTEIINILNKGYSILPKKRKFRRTLYGQYKKYHIEDNLIVMKNILLEKHPEYEKSFQKYFHTQKRGYFYNMMILSKENFDNYCSWLFDILFELEKRITPSEDPYQKRVFGFLSERMLGLYLFHNKIKIKEKQLLFFP